MYCRRHITHTHTWKLIFIKNRTFSLGKLSIIRRKPRLLAKSQRSIVIQAVTTTTSFKAFSQRRTHISPGKRKANRFPYIATFTVTLEIKLKHFTGSFNFCLNIQSIKKKNGPPSSPAFKNGREKTHNSFLFPTGFKKTTTMHSAKQQQRKKCHLLFFCGKTLRC